MLEGHANVVNFISLAGEITGRKKLQKMIYIAKKMNFSFAEKYHFHMYGPYSEELSLRIEELCTMGFLTETKEHKGAYTQYKYGVTEKGRTFLTGYDYMNDTLMQMTESLNAQPSRFLELVSTLLYFDELPLLERIEKVRKVKAKLNFTDEEMDRALRMIEQLTTFKNN